MIPILGLFLCQAVSHIEMINAPANRRVMTATFHSNSATGNDYAVIINHYHYAVINHYLS